MFNLYWVSQDKCSSIPMGEYLTYDAAQSSIDACKNELERQCNEINTVEDIRAGFWRIEE